jgi:hypothetical protein
MGDEFNSYLKCLLDEVDIDSDVYSSFIISILDDSDLQQFETEKTLLDLFEPFKATIRDTVSFTQEILSKYKSSLINNLNFDNYSANCTTNSHADSIFEFIPQYCAESDEYQPTEKVDYSVDKMEDDIADNSDTIDAHGEELQQLYNNYMHWMYLIDQVDSKANPSSSSTERFSADAISCALHSTESDIDKSVEALLYTKHIADTCRPCRHALTSRCMRKDCYFDHNMYRNIFHLVLSINFTVPYNIIGQKFHADSGCLMCV